MCHHTANYYFQSIIENISLKIRKDLLKNDHADRVQELNLLFQNSEGLWSWLPKGESIRQILLDFWKNELVQQNFDFVSTPQFSDEEVGPLLRVEPARIRHLSRPQLGPS